ncbi:histidine phosphatase family protein [Cohnella sp. CFH 77786]|uniref:histidine phosphatase family protein n=1 Tax=Cohnella sp. CFH 77786 TaxID=2662265 RepID=UPI001C60CD7F|nr:histidine phosphatase family protein [Cohnella sp. CFH 77786]MBW5446223.1 histidine phosphatase family protein [Cohnella sp. CFH 77786]
MTLIALIRHGSTYWNRERRMQGHAGNPLDEEGWRQARSLADRLSLESWDALYASDLPRARQTAEILLEALPLNEIRFNARLRELNRGLAEGTTEEERVSRWGTDWRKLELGIETDAAGTARGAAFIRDVAALHPGRRILAVSHGNILRLALKGVMPDLDTDTVLDNTSVTLIRLRDGQWDCALYNCSKHLTIAGNGGIR